MDEYTRKIVACTVAALGLAISGCGGSGSSSGDSDDNGEAGVEEVGSILLSAEPAPGELILEWETDGGSPEAFNVCTATEDFSGDFPNCDTYAASNSQVDVTSPLTVSGLENELTYFAQVEAEIADGDPVYSNLVEVELAAVPGTTTEQVIPGSEFNNLDLVGALNKAGPYTLVTTSNFFDTSIGFWSTDGTETNFITVDKPGADKEYESIKMNRRIGESIHVANLVYFTAERDDTLDIWVTDGTEAGTERVVDGEVLGLARFSLFRYFAALDTTVAFVARDSAESADRVYIIDSSETGGARKLTDFEPFSGGRSPQVKGFNGKFYMSSNEDGERRLSTLNPDTLDINKIWFIEEGTAPNDMVVAEDGVMYFIAGDNPATAVWAVEDENPVRLFDPDPDSEDLDENSIRGPQNLKVVLDRVFFFVQQYDPELNSDGDWINPRRLGVTIDADLSVGGDITAVGFWNDSLGNGWTGNTPANMRTEALGDRFLFKSPETVDDDPEWWVTDGSADSTEQIFVDGEPVSAPSSADDDFASSESEQGVWTTSNSQQEIHFIAENSEDSFKVEADGLVEIDNLLDKNGELWFTAKETLSGGGTSDPGVWRIPLSQ